jgi:hypothetical protein
MNASWGKGVAAAVLAMSVVGVTSFEPRAQGVAQLMASGLDNPRDLRFGPDGFLYVVEAGRGGNSNLCIPSPEGGAPACYGPTGAVTRIDAPGVHRRVVTGLPSVAPAGGHDATGPTDFDFGFNRGWLVVGLGANPAARAAFDAAGVRLGTLVAVEFTGQWNHVVDLAAHEAAANPDGGAIDSNPYSVRILRDRALIADAGANALLAVGLNAQVSTVATFPSRSVEGPGGTVQMQSVPTAVTDGPDGFLYVAELTGFPFPVGGARIYRLQREGGTPSVFASGFTNIIDIAFETSGVMWVLEHDADGLLGPGENGRLIRVLNGQQQVVTTALTKPGGLAIGLDGFVYVTNHSTSAGRGEVWRIAR